jgi:hypothetical protein
MSVRSASLPSQTDRGSEPSRKPMSVQVRESMWVLEEIERGHASLAPGHCQGMQ